MERRQNIAVIPARHHATRFPGKPLVPIAGVPMVVRVAQRVSEVRQIDEVMVATDDERIREVVERAGFVSAMTEATCPSGTDRVAAALAQRPGPPPSLVLNVQGDEPLVDPRALERLVVEASRRPDAITTMARPMTERDDPHAPHQVKVARAGDGRALYFSRACIPHGAPALLHVGVYACAPSVLQRFVGAQPTALERAERLEQLRALELGIPIHVTVCQGDHPTIGVDVPEDVGRVEAVLTAARHRGTT